MRNLLLLLFFIPCLSFGQWTYGAYKDLNTNDPYSVATNNNLSVEKQYTYLIVTLHDTIAFTSRNIKMIMTPTDSTLDVVKIKRSCVVDSNVLFITMKLSSEKFYQSFNGSKTLLIQILDSKGYFIKEFNFDMTNTRDAIGYLLSTKPK